MFKTLIKKIRQGKLSFLVLLALVVIIVLPSGWDDVFTTLPLLAFLGIQNYAILAAFVVFLVFWFKDELKGLIR